MTDRKTDFEDQLRQLKPTSCDERLPQTFYSAGWDACEQTKAAMLRKAFEGNRKRSFVGGLLCGLLVAVGVSAWPQSSNDPQPRQQMAAPDSPGSEFAVANHQTGGSEYSRTQSDSLTEINETNVSAIDWKSLTSTFSPWEFSHASAFDEAVPAAARPLSIAARQHWSCLVVAEHNVNRDGEETSADHSEAPESTSPLRTFPATEERLRELL